MLSLNLISLNRDCTVQISLRFGSMIGYKDNGQKRIQLPRCTLADIHMFVLLLMTEKLLLWQVILRKKSSNCRVVYYFCPCFPILIGGLTKKESDGDGTVSVEILQISSSTWHKMPALPHPMYGGVC